MAGNAGGRGRREGRRQTPHEPGTQRAQGDSSGVPDLVETRPRDEFGRNLLTWLSNIYMRRFILGWKVLGYARRFCAEIVNYADDRPVCHEGTLEPGG